MRQVFHPSRLTAIALSLLIGLTVCASETELQPIQEIFEPSGVYPESQFVKVAVIQWAPPDARIVSTKAEAEPYKRRNRNLIAETIREAASNGAKIIITSEFGVVGYPHIPGIPEEDMNFRSPEEIAPYAEVVPGTSSSYFSSLAEELGVYIQFGLAEEDNNLYYNTAVAIGPDGRILAKHRKLSLYKQEKSFLTEGSNSTTFDTPAGKIGMMICSDVYHSKLLNDYRGNVAALALSTSWAQMNTGWDHFTSAARSVRAHIMAANQPYFPDSGVANPNGSAQSHIRQTSGIAYGYLPILKDQSKD